MVLRGPLLDTHSSLLRPATGRNWGSTLPRCRQAGLGRKRDLPLWPFGVMQPSCPGAVPSSYGTAVATAEATRGLLAPWPGQALVWGSATSPTTC